MRPRVLLLILLLPALEPCLSCSRPGLEGTHLLQGDLRTAHPVSECADPREVGIGLFPEESFDAERLLPVEEPLYWATTSSTGWPIPFEVDPGAPFSGWIVAVVDCDANGLLDTPRDGDWIGIHPAPIESPRRGLEIRVEWEWRATEGQIAHPLDPSLTASPPSTR